MTKRSSCNEGGITRAVAKHRIGYNPSWKIIFPWHVAVKEKSDSGSSSAGPLLVTGLLCWLCRRHQIRQRTVLAPGQTSPVLTCARTCWRGMKNQ